MKKRILITGASGMLGACLVEAFSGKFEVFATGGSDFQGNRVANYLKFDLKEASYKPLIDWANPDVIVHCAALTNGNYCNAHPDEAFHINGISLKKLAESSGEGAVIIYISTDAVFPSSIHLAAENDCVSPENVYGKSKELGEFFLRTSEREYTIIRTTIVGLNANQSKQSFVEWIISSVQNNQEIQLFDDVIFTPISIWDLASEIETLIVQGAKEKFLHIAGSEICSKYDFGIALLNALSLPVAKIKRGKITDFKDRAKRCADQTLDCGKYQDLYNKKLPNLQQTIQSVLKNISAK